MPTLLHQRSDADAKHYANNENSAATNNERQNHRKNGPTDVCLLAAADPDTIRDQSPNQCDRTAATWNDAEQCSCTIGKTQCPKARLEGLVRAAEHHQADVHKSGPDEETDHDENRRENNSEEYHRATDARAQHTRKWASVRKRSRPTKGMSSRRKQNPNNRADSAADHSEKKRIANPALGSHYCKSLGRASQNHRNGLHKSIKESERVAMLPR